MTLRIGLIGAGSIFRQRHLPGLASIRDAQVVAICNRTEVSGRKIADEFGLQVDLLTDPQALLARSDIDAVMIGTWPYRHAEYAIASLHAGKHTFVQARMAMDLAEARSMLAASLERPHLAAQVCPSPLALGAGDYFGELLAEGYVGTIRQIALQSLSSGAVDSTRPLHWRDRRRYSGLNALNMGILFEDLLRWFGPMRDVSATAHIFTSHRPLPEGGEGPVERPESVALSGTLQQGAAITMLFSAAAPFGGGTQVQVHGSGGTLIYDLDHQQLRGARLGEGRLRDLAVPEEKRTTWRVEQDFIRAIRTGAPVRTTFADGVAYMEQTEAVFRSVEEKRLTQIPLN